MRRPDKSTWYNISYSNVSFKSVLLAKPHRKIEVFRCPSGSSVHKYLYAYPFLWFVLTDFLWIGYTHSILQYTGQVSWPTDFIILYLPPFWIRVSPNIKGFWGFHVGGVRLEVIPLSSFQYYGSATIFVNSTLICDFIACLVLFSRRKGISAR